MKKDDRLKSGWEEQWERDLRKVSKSLTGNPRYDNLLLVESLIVLATPLDTTKEIETKRLQVERVEHLKELCLIAAKEERIINKKGTKG